MWRLKTVPHKARLQGSGLEEFKLKRREQERALRQARRDRQLVSKRVLLHEDEDDAFEGEGTMDTCITPTSDQVVKLLHGLQAGGEKRTTLCRELRRALRDLKVQLIFIRLENSMRVVVSLLSGSDAQCRVEAGKCLHTLSHSPHPEVGMTCLLASPYLLTYLSGQSAKFTELCLYTLGNLCPENELVREKLLAQGIIPALHHCLQNHGGNLAVLEAVAFALSQLLQARDAEQKIIPLVLTSGLTSHLMAGLNSDPEYGIGASIECAWCLHYLSCSETDSSVLVNHGALSRCSSLMVTLGGAVAHGESQDGLELLIWPLLRCLGNLLARCDTCEEVGACVNDCRLLAALGVFAQSYLHTHPALGREALWVLNNLTADSVVWCSAVLGSGLVPVLIQLMPFSQGINSMVLRTLGNVAYKGTAFCLQLVEAGVLPALCATLKMADAEVVTLSLEVLHLLVASSPQVAEGFVQLKGVSVLEMMLFNSEEALRLRASYIIDHLPQPGVDGC
ncbi:transmembrane and coiled-coil domain-containing protein 6 [Clupea harengus]|uniref:Transmembrane and coiled-coil domain-containing protein 6 n=1 Tax=Clupea harengus TaxID=7950 RepID=A0A6P3W2Y9_CLUHA|nr:transmembrane and coiled-coil domain-containing protein 6 [Clupea harengus]XP_031442753.1 transmembrane and coiled-coil domain-containing protein 6 [Clupea harengus]